MNEENKARFEKASADRESSLVGEFMAMVKENKKYWLVPLIVALLVFGLIIILAGSAAAPFIYTIF